MLYRYPNIPDKACGKTTLLLEVVPVLYRSSRYTACVNIGFRKEAKKGFTKNVKNINNNNLVVDLPKGIKYSSYIHRIQGEGFPIRKEGNIVGKGDMLIKFNVHID